MPIPVNCNNLPKQPEVTMESAQPAESAHPSSACRDDAVTGRPGNSETSEDAPPPPSDHVESSSEDELDNSSTGGDESSQQGAKRTINGQIEAHKARLRKSLAAYDLRATADWFQEKNEQLKTNNEFLERQLFIARQKLLLKDSYDAATNVLAILRDLYERETTRKTRPRIHLQPASSNDEYGDVGKVMVKNGLKLRAITNSIIKSCFANMGGGIQNMALLGRLVHLLVAEYRTQYPMLTVNMVLDAIAKQKIPEMNHCTQTIAVHGGNIVQSISSIIDLCVPLIDDEMDRYYAKIESLRRSRGKDRPAVLVTQGFEAKRKAPPEALALYTTDPPKYNLADTKPESLSLTTPGASRLNNEKLTGTKKPARLESESQRESQQYKDVMTNGKLSLKSQMTSAASQRYQEAVAFVEKDVPHETPNKTHTQECQIDSHWTSMYEELTELFVKNGNCIVPSDRPVLKEWAAIQQNLFVESKLSNEKIELLSEIDFFHRKNHDQRNRKHSDEIVDHAMTSHEERWNKRYEQLAAFYAENGQYAVPSDPRLQNWVRKQRQRSRMSKLSEHRTRMLKAINFDLQLPEKCQVSGSKRKLDEIIFENLDDSNGKPNKGTAMARSLEQVWNANYSKMLAMYEQQGNLERLVEDIPLLKWANTQRVRYKNNNLRADKAEKLRAIGYDLDAPYSDFDRGTNWETKFSMLVDFHEENGHFDVPKGVNSGLRNWIRIQRAKYRASKLSSRAVAKLNAVGFPFEVQEEKDNWDDRYQELLAIYQELGTVKKIRSMAIRRWANDQRIKYRDNKLPQDKIDKLRAVGFDLDAYRKERSTSNLSWDDHYKVLADFHAENGHCNVPKANKSLIYWIQMNRKKYRTSELSAEQQQKLTEINFPFVHHSHKFAPKGSNQSKYKVLSEASDEDLLMKEILRIYFERKEECDTAPKLDEIIEEAHHELELEHVDMDKKLVYQHIKADKRYQKVRDPIIDYEYDGDESKAKEALIDAAYAKYCAEKTRHGNKMPKGTADRLIEETQVEMGLEGIEIKKKWILSRYSREHGVLATTTNVLSEEEKKKKQHLLNAITQRVYDEKGGDKGKHLGDARFKQIIEETKRELGMESTHVRRNTIYARLHRDQTTVFTLGKDSPYNEIDEPLVEALNSCLRQGESVTRAQGIEIANKILRAKRLAEGRGEVNFVLDARWFATFMKRNKRRLQTKAVLDD